MGLPVIWLRVQYACLLLSAKWRVADGEYEAARSAVERIADLYAARELEAPLCADIMSGLIAWSLGEYDATALCVRRAADEIGRRLAAERQPALRHELNYLRAYCWTLLHYSESAGATVHWENFADLVPASYVNLTRVSRTIREMFPVDDQVFVLEKP